MLSERLQELEHEGIVDRTVVPETPVRVEYSLTRKGKALATAIDALAAWAEKWIEPEPKAAYKPSGRAVAPAPEPRPRTRLTAPPFWNGHCERWSGGGSPWNHKHSSLSSLRPC